MNIVEINGVSKSYGDHQALDNINFNIPENSVFGLLGPNGAGKTTLIRVITQIIMPDSGGVCFNGEPMTSEHVRKIGYLPEERGLYKKMKVAEQLLYLARLKGMTKSDAIEAINYWLDRFDIRSWINKNIEDLSKGMQQKIQFIATVVHNPSLIILDEPFSGFDPVNANLIKDEILELKDKGATIIFSTHRMESVEQLCDHITLIHHSKVLLNGTTKAIKNDFRSNTFMVEYRGDLNLLDQGFDVKSTLALDENDFRSEIQLGDHNTVNDLTNYITSQTSIISLNEKVPSINDIFISTVDPSTHE